MPRKKWDFFIAHASADAALADELFTLLHREQVQVFLADRCVKLGDTWDQELAAAQRASLITIVLVSQGTEQAYYQREEIAAALALARDDATSHRVVPVFVDSRAEGSSLPYGLRLKQGVSLSKTFQLPDLAGRLLGLLEGPRNGVQGNERRVFEYTKDILADLSNVAIPIPLQRPIRPVESLKRLPRSGKLIRLYTFRPKIPIRSIYDHVLSVAHSADCLINVIDHRMNEQEYIDLARCIAYHDICESILGDMPAYTNLTRSKRSRAQVAAGVALGRFPAVERERITNDFIAMYFDERERSSMSEAREIIADKKSAVGRFFYILDRIDPIVCVWRYLFRFRGQLGRDPAAFVRRLKDFFEFRQVKKIAQAYREDGRVYGLVVMLQNQRRALAYHFGKRDIREMSSEFGLDGDVAKRLVEGRELLFAGRKRKADE